MPTNLLDMMGYMQDQVDTGKAEGRQSKLAQIASQAYAAPQDQRQGLVQQAIGVDPQSGFALGQNLQGDEDARMERVGQMAGMLVTLPAQARPQAYAGIVRELHGIGLGEGLPDQWSDDLLPYAQQLAGQLGGSNTPSGYQEFDLLARDANLSPEDRALAARRALYLDRRPSNAAMKYEGIEGGDGRTRMFALDPNNPNATQIGGQAPIPPQGDQFAFLGGIPGVTITSGQRTPEHNREVGGVPNSYHLTGQARDILPPTNPRQAALIRQQAAANGLEIIDEGDHWHMEPRGSVDPFTSRRPEDEAAAKAVAEEQAKLGLLPERGRIEAENEGLKKSAELAATRQSEKIENLPKARAALQGAKVAGENVSRAIAQALPNVNVWTAGYMGVPLSKLGSTAATDLRANLDTIEANIAFDRLQQMRQSSPTGGALGSVSERELTLLGSALTSLKQSQSPEQLRSNLQFLQQQYDKVLKQLEADFEKDFGGGSSQPQGNFAGFRVLD